MEVINKEEIIKLLKDKIDYLYENDIWIDFSSTEDKRFTVEIDEIKIRKTFSDYNPIVEVRINDKLFLTTRNNNDIKIEDLIDLLKHIENLYTKQFVKYLKNKKK